MMDGVLTDRGRALEEEYFRKRERELIERLRHDTEARVATERIGAAIGIADVETLRNLQQLGYTTETIKLLYLVPLLQVAWADGSISQQERDLIFEVANSRGIEAGPALEQLTAWLDSRPPEEFFDRTLRLIGDVFSALPQDRQQMSKHDLVSYCTRVAEASGGIMGFLGVGNNVSGVEKNLLERITTELGHHAPK